jgi:hypothetical protein
MRLEDIYADFQNLGDSFSKIAFLENLRGSELLADYNIKIDGLIKAWERRNR